MQLIIISGYVEFSYIIESDIRSDKEPCTKAGIENRRKSQIIVVEVIILERKIVHIQKVRVCHVFDQIGCHSSDSCCIFV